MALVSFLAPISKYIGSIGRSTFSNTGSNIVVKKKTRKGINGSAVASGPQLKNYSTLSHISALWDTLTQAQQNGWNAAALLYPKTNRLGNTYYSSGFNMFMQNNENLNFIASAQILDAPVKPTITTISSFTVSVSGSYPYTISLNIGSTPTAVDMKYLIFATDGLSTGKSYVRSQYRLVGVIYPGNSGIIDISANYLTVFNKINPLSKIFVKLIPVQFPTGFKGAALSAYTNEIPSGPPIPLTDLLLWFNASLGITMDGSNLVSAWSDQSGNHNDAIQPSGINQPLFVPAVINGQPVLRFNSGADFLKFSQVNLIDSTIFIVLNASQGSGVIGSDNYADDGIELGYYWPILFSSYTSIDSAIGYSDIFSYNAFHILQLRQSGSTSDGQLDGTDLTVGSIHNEPINPIIDLIGYNGFNGGFYGDIAEIIIYNAASSDSDRDQVTNYLQAKYGL